MKDIMLADTPVEQRTMTQEERQRNVFRAIRGNAMDKTGTDD